MNFYSRQQGGEPFRAGAPDALKRGRMALAGYALVSAGILLATAGGGWDVTNHLLNKPETFFAPPHAMLYAGVATALAGAALVALFLPLRGNRRWLWWPAKLVVAGIAVLVSAGPVDFVWHSAYGLDGLLSPPHFVLVSGMVAGSVGALAGMILLFSRSGGRGVQGGIDDDSNTNDDEKRRKGLPPHLVVLGMLPVVLAVSGLAHMFSLPFSETPYFDFNPHPAFAVVFATIAFPLLLSTAFSAAPALAGRGGGKRGSFGIASALGAAFVTVNTLTSIVPNDMLLPTIPFYAISIVPIVAADALLTLWRSSRAATYAAGAVLGLAFITLYYPLITHTYNEALSPERAVWPSLTAPIYFEIMDSIFPFVAAPAAAMGVLGSAIVSKLCWRQQKHAVL